MPARLEQPPSTVSGSAFLGKVVVPVLKEHLPAPDDDDPPGATIEHGEDGSPVVHAFWRGTQLLSVGFRRRDEKRATVNFNLHVGTFLDGAADAVLRLGPILESTAFHLNFDPPLVLQNQLTVGSQLAIHTGDADLVRERTASLARLAADMDWICSLYFPQRLGFVQMASLARAVGEDLDVLDDLPERLEAGLRDPGGIHDGQTLVLIAQGLGRWRDVLRALRRASGPADAAFGAPLAARAWQELGRWDRALDAARTGGIDEGRFEGAPWLSPCYLRALIETGDDIEALRLLDRPVDGEPGFYDLLRGKALFAAGDKDRSRAAFARYLDQWPGDLDGQTEASRLFHPHD